MQFRYLPLFALFLVSFLPGRLISGNTVEYRFSMGEFTMSGSGKYSNLLFKGAMQTAMHGQPEIPWFKVSLMLPPGQAAESLAFIGDSLVEIPGQYILRPHQPSQPLSLKGDPGFFINQTLYNSDESYPISKCGALMTQYLNGIGFALSSFSPVVYFPASGKLMYYAKGKIIIRTKPAETGQYLNSKPGKMARERALNLAQNPEMLAQYDYPLPADTTAYQMLIIAPAVFENRFQPLVSYYQSRGIRVKVKSLATVYGNSTGIDNAQKIRNYIIQQYQVNHIEHVLLAGDAELMPYRGLYCEVMSSSLYIDNNIPSDIYFSSLDGSWNNDGDSKWGEPGEEDLLPDISVGRFCASDTNDLNIMLNKTILYQQNPVVADLDKPLLVGEKLWSSPNTWGADFMNLLVGTHSEYGYTTTGLDTTQLYDTLYDKGLPTPWNYLQLLEKINQGHSFLYHVGHANTDYVMRLYNGNITNANFSLVNGVTHGFMPVYSHGCYCGQFDASDCIAERMLCISNFSNVFIGNSRYGWFNEGSSDGPSQHINREFTDAIYNDGEKAVGMAHTISKIATAPWVTAPGQWEEGALRWCMFTCNVLGDPAMQIWTNAPGSLQGTVQYANLAATPLDSVWVYLLKNGDTIRQYLADTTGHYAFTAVPAGTYSLGVRCIRPWGGVNSTDALQVLKHFVNMVNLQGLYRKAADIDGSLYINSIDAMAIQKRFVGIINAFQMEDWIFDHPEVIINPNIQSTVNISGICSGDVNGSYQPQ
jgi:hypothetical protein